MNDENPVMKNVVTPSPCRTLGHTEKEGPRINTLSVGGLCWGGGYPLLATFFFGGSVSLARVNPPPPPVS